MATIQITVPINGSRELRESFQKEVSSILDAGNDVQFVNESNQPVNVPFIGLFNGADGAVRHKTVSGDAIVTTLASSGFHQVWVNTLLAEGTDSSLGIYVRLS
jgi:hypothetical protein